MIITYKKFKKEIVIDEENADFVKRAFELYATGMYSFKTLGDTLYREGFRHPKTGKKYPVRKFEWMLHNPFYIGKFEWDGKQYEGSHTSLITKDLFYKVQSLFETVDKSKKHTVEFAYSGLIKCAECGCYLTAEFKRGKSKRGHYIYYHCSNSKDYHDNLKCIRQEYFDNTFAEVLQTFHLTPEHIAKIRQLASNYLKDYAEQEQKITKEIEQQLNAIKKRIHNSYIDKLEGRLPDSIKYVDLDVFRDFHNKQIAKERARVEHVFAAIKSVFKFTKLRYRGLERVTAIFESLIIAYNFYRLGFLLRTRAICT